MPWQTISPAGTFLKAFRRFPLILPSGPVSDIKNNFVSKIVSFGIENYGHLSHRNPKYKSRSCISLHILKSKYRAPPRHYMLPLEFQTLLILTKHIFYFTKYINLGS